MIFFSFFIKEGNITHKRQKDPIDAAPTEEYRRRGVLMLSCLKLDRTSLVNMLRKGQIITDRMALRRSLLTPHLIKGESVGKATAMHYVKLRCIGFLRVFGNMPVKAQRPELTSTPMFPSAGVFVGGASVGKATAVHYTTSITLVFLCLFFLSSSEQKVGNSQRLL